MKLSRLSEPGRTIVYGYSSNPSEYTNSGFFNFSKSAKISNWQMFACGYTLQSITDVIYTKLTNNIKGNCADTYKGVVLCAYNQFEGEYKPSSDNYSCLGIILNANETDKLVNLVNNYNHADDTYTSNQYRKEMDDLFNQATKKQYPKYSIGQKIKRFFS